MNPSAVWVISPSTLSTLSVSGVVVLYKVISISLPNTSGSVLAKSIS